MTNQTTIPFVDLQAQRRRIGARIDAAIARVLEHGAFIMGPEIVELEHQLAAFAGAKHAVSCASGTDALALVLMAKGVKAGQAVLCPSFTFCATAEVVAWVGATPVFVDVDADTFNISPDSLEAGIAEARRLKLDPVGVIPVDLFGLPCDYDAVSAIAAKHGLWVLGDAAQAFGGEYKGKRLGTQGLATATSFFPAKPLGCYGDGGAVTTDDAELAKVLRSLRVHGQGSAKYDNVRIGMAGRLDTLQAAILIEKLAIFPDEIDRRDRVAARYTAALSDVSATPKVPSGRRSVWAQYTLRIPAERRQHVMDRLKAQGVPTMVYYPKGVHAQAAYAHFPTVPGGLPVTERLAHEVMSLPMHPYLEPAAQDRIISALRAAL